ncbi:unnamed protein product [Caenorhabditis nigoni]
MNNIDVNLTFINSTFINVENLNRDSSIAIGILITFCSVLTNSFAVFLIVTKSKKETTAYKIALVSSRVLLCSAQFQFGFLMCIVPLLPFPAFIFYGVLRKHVDLILLICYMCLSVLIFLEVRIRVNSMSASMQKYHLKVLKNILQEILIKLVTFIFYPFFTCVQYFVVPEYDSIRITMFLYNIFVAAPIPGTVVLIVQTPSYRQYLMKAFQKRVRVESS